MAIVKDFYCEKLHIRVFDSRNALGECAAAEIAATIKTLLAQKDHINVMFAAAPSQNEMLAALLNDNEIQWERVNAFHMDEYVGLDPAHPAGFRNFLNRAIFEHKPFKSVHLLNGNAEDPQQEADRYGKLLEENPLDICLLGVGENGHLAFNDPPVANFEDKPFAKVVELEDRCRKQQINDGCFETLDQVPTHALTVTIPGLLVAKYKFAVVPAATKAEAIGHLVHDEISTACPATILRQCEGTELYVDTDSGKNIL